MQYYLGLSISYLPSTVKGDTPSLVRIDPKFVDPSAPILTQDDLNNTFGEADEDAKIVLANLNAWKPLGPLLQPSKNSGGEPHHGRVPILETGELSLSEAL